VRGGAVEPRFLDDVGEPYPAFLPDREDAQDLHRPPDALRTGDLARGDVASLHFFITVLGVCATGVMATISPSFA
jgi:hypothetical protein